MQLSLKLLQLRKNQRYSQEYVADEIGVSKTTLRKWEADESMPTLQNLQKLSDFYNVKMTFWFAEKDTREEKEALTQLKEFFDQGQQLLQELEKK